MCTALLSIDPGLPALLVGVRDELSDRPWEPPGRHWPDHPDLVGGRDLQAGGTWLAVSPARQRASCVLNALGQPAPEAARLTRGSLPLRAAAGEPLARSELSHLDPFHLLTVEPARALWQSWDGRQLTERELGPGLHFAVNSGLASDLLPETAEGVANGGVANGGAANDRVANGGAANGRVANGRAHELARIGYFLPRLKDAARPDPRPGQSVADAWGEWFPLVNGNGIGTDDDRALIVRRELGGGRVWGTSSISLIALSPSLLRYDFTARPGDPAGWYAAYPG
jgi:hypothetical protein